MRRENIEDVERLSREFLECIRDWKTRFPSQESKEFSLLVGSKESGALRRKSLDLTRALAKMRGRD